LNSFLRLLTISIAVNWDFFLNEASQFDEVLHGTILQPGINLPRLCPKLEKL